MKHSRRDFLKGAFAGVFGAFLTWTGAMKAEGLTVPKQDLGTKLDHFQTARLSYILREDAVVR